MATKKSKTYQGITVEVGGEVIGKIRSWDPTPLDEKGTWPEKYTDLVSRFSSCGKPVSGMQQISFPVGSLPEFFGPECSGKTTLGLSMLRKLLEPGHLYVRAQLDMWGLEKTGEVCWECLSEIVTTLEDMGYNVWFDQKSSIDETVAEACGVVVQDYELEYVGVREEQKDE